MKKKGLIIGIIIAVLVVAVVIGLLFAKKKLEENSKTQVVTLDINPSIELTIEEKIVKKINPLNDDAKELITSEFEEKSLDVVFEEIVKSIRDKGFMEENFVPIILGMEKKDDNIEKELREAFIKYDINYQIFVPEITEEAKKEAKSHGVTPAKAAYLLDILKGSEGLTIDDIKDKSTYELKDMKESGSYCDPGFTLRGTLCMKAIKEAEPQSGKVCPDKTFEYQGKCYESVPVEDTDTLTCFGEDRLEDDKCVNVDTRDATPVKYNCPSGELALMSDVGLSVEGSGENRYVCVDYSKAQEPVLRCLYNSGHIMINGKCYNGPAPTINGGCPNGDTLRGGWCYSLDTYDQYQCPDGRIYEKSKDYFPKYCPDTLKTTTPIVEEYKCEDDFVLEGNKCTRTAIRNADHERTCPSGYTLVDNAGCINKSVVKNKEDGFICERDYELEGNKCIYYEMRDAKKK